MIFQIVGGIFFLTAVVLLFFAYKSYAKIKVFISLAEKTVGKVINVNSSTSTSSDMDGYTTTSTIYTPEIEFTTATGEKVVYASNVGTSNKNKWRIGKEVEVLYNPKNVDDAKINTNMQLYFSPIILGFLGVIFGIIGGVFLFI